MFINSIRDAIDVVAPSLYAFASAGVRKFALSGRPLYVCGTCVTRNGSIVLVLSEQPADAYLSDGPDGYAGAVVLSPLGRNRWAVEGLRIVRDTKVRICCARNGVTQEFARTIT